MTIHGICPRQEYSGMKQTLFDMPTNLAAMFDLATGRIRERRDQGFAQNMFRWAAVVRKPLTLAQVQEVLSVDWTGYQ